MCTTGRRLRWWCVRKVWILTHCNTLQHTATHCNTPQHTTTQETEKMVRDKGVDIGEGGALFTNSLQFDWDSVRVLGSCSCLNVCVSTCPNAPLQSNAVPTQEILKSLFTTRYTHTHTFVSTCPRTNSRSPLPATSYRDETWDVIPNN